MSISERLASVSTSSQLHELFCEMAADPACRWTRTQILHYLPDSLRNVAAEYFVGERLVIPERRAVQLETPDPVALAEALEALVGAREEQDEKEDSFPR